MPSIKPLLNFRPDAQGRYTLIIQIIHKRKKAALFTPFRLLPGEFDPEKGAAVSTSRNRAHRVFIARVNKYLEEQISELRRIICALEEGPPFHVRQITGLYKTRTDNRYIHTFTGALIRTLEQGGKWGTARSYASALAAFSKFSAGRQYQFEQLDAALVEGFGEYMKAIPLQRNTVTFYMRILRAIYNKARRQGFAPRSSSPFERISFRIDKTRKLAVGTRTLKKISAASFPGRPHLEEARDLFMFSFYARGMSFVDMAYLQRRQIKDGAIYYKRHKTGQLFTIKLIPPLQAILDKYEPVCSPWALPVMSRRSGEKNGPGSIPLGEGSGAETLRRGEWLNRQYKSALGSYLNCLGIISRELQTEKKLSFNVARHSWASLARNKGIPVAVISRSLGHTSEKTTAIYLDELEARQVDRANEMVSRL